MHVQHAAAWDGGKCGEEEYAKRLAVIVYETKASSVVGCCWRSLGSGMEAGGLDDEWELRLILSRRREKTLVPAAFRDGKRTYLPCGRTYIVAYTECDRFPPLPSISATIRS